MNERDSKEVPSTTEIIEKTLKLCNECSEVAVSVKDILRHQLRVYDSDIELFKRWDTTTMDIFVSIDGRVGCTTIENPTVNSIENKIADFVSFTKGLNPTNLWKGMQKEILPPTKIDGIYDKRIQAFPERAPELIHTALDEASAAGAKRTAGTLFFDDVSTQIATSYGFNGKYRGSSYELTLRSFMDDPRASGQGISVGRDMTDIEKNFRQAGRESGEIAARSVHGKLGAAGTYDLVLHPTVAASIMCNLMQGANPLLMLMGMSPFLGFLNQKIAVDFLNVWDDGTMPNGLATTPFDFEGTPTQRTPLFENGKLSGIVHSATTAKMYMTRSTGNANMMQIMRLAKLLVPTPTNIVFEPGDHSLDELLESSSNRPTIYVTSNWYLRWTNQIEGIFSTIPRDGMFLIEHGEIGQPVQKLRISDNMFRILENIEALGKDIRQVKWWEVDYPTFIPTMRIRDVPMTSASQ
ncbi:MAG: TldD/PmbA family protein [Promethearchaeota archaeon]